MKPLYTTLTTSSTNGKTIWSIPGELSTPKKVKSTFENTNTPYRKINDNNIHKKTHNSKWSYRLEIPLNTNIPDSIIKYRIHT